MNVLVCRMACARKAWHCGAVGYLMEGPKPRGCRVKVLIASRSGRWIRQWVNILETDCFEFAPVAVFVSGCYQVFDARDSLGMLDRLSSVRMHEQAKRFKKLAAPHLGRGRP